MEHKEPVLCEILSSHDGSYVLCSVQCSAKHSVGTAVGREYLRVW
jgi:hypothetical protein